jgi:hypothetical protein
MTVDLLGLVSFDAEFTGVVAEPRDAYRFARGEALEIPPFEHALHAARRSFGARSTSPQ